MSTSLGFFFFSSRRRHTSFSRDWSSDVCSSDLTGVGDAAELTRRAVECDLPDAMSAALARVQTLAVDDADFVGIAGAAVELGHLTRYRDVRKFDPAPLRPLLA